MTFVLHFPICFLYYRVSWNHCLFLFLSFFSFIGTKTRERNLSIEDSIYYLYFWPRWPDFLCFLYMPLGPTLFPLLCSLNYSIHFLAKNFSSYFCWCLRKNLPKPSSAPTPACLSLWLSLLYRILQMPTDLYLPTNLVGLYIGLKYISIPNLKVKRYICF